MQYINPIEILGLSNVADTSFIDNENVKKAKRKLFADIDLSDNELFDYYGVQLTKGDCEKVINELTNNDFKEFYLYLTTNKKLNSFLANGNDEVFANFKQDSIFKLPEFVKFISPYYAPRFDKALLYAFENEDEEQTKAILKTSFLISQSEVNNAYRSVSINIQNKINEILEIKNDIKNEESIYDEYDIDEVVDLVIEYFPSRILNCLPIYFQSQILNIANTINYLQLSIWDAYDNTQVPNDLLEHLLTLKIDGLNKPTFENNYKIVKKKNDERIAEEKNAPILKQYARYLIQTRSKIEELKNKSITPNSLSSWVNSSISISNINLLSSDFDEIKNQVAQTLIVLSIGVWNSYTDSIIAIQLLDKANSINNLKYETKQKILSSLQFLLQQQAKSERLKTRTEEKKTVEALPVLQKPQLKTKQSDIDKNDTKLGFIILWSVIIVTIIIIYIFKSNNLINDGNHSNSNNTYESPVNYSTSNDISSETTVTPAASVEDIPVSDNNSSSAEPSPYADSKYKGNQLNDGASPLTGCFGKGIYSGNATLTIKNGGNSDAIICLYSISDDRTIRNEYVRKSSDFTMSNIAQGEYKIRVFYGNDWNPDLENSCGTKGNFESDINFSEFDGTEYFEDSDRGFTNATITLYTVAGGNASSSSIDQSQFFRK